MSAAHELIIQFPLNWTRQESTPAPAAEPLHPLRDEIVALRASLTGALARSISTATELRRRDSHLDQSLHPTMALPFDEILGGGLPRGHLTEVVGSRSSGRFALVISTLAAATQAGDAAALIDLGDSFDPAGAEQAGVDLARLLWVRPPSVKEAVLAADMLIGTGFPLVVIDLGLRLRGRRAAEASWVRLSRTAEHHGATLLLSSPFPISGTVAEAVVSMRRSRTRWRGEGLAPRLLDGVEMTVTLDKHRKARSGTTKKGALRAG
jgi:hypothetical protein